MDALPTFVSVRMCRQCLRRSEGGIRASGTEVTDGCVWHGGERELWGLVLLSKASNTQFRLSDVRLAWQVLCPLRRFTSPVFYSSTCCLSWLAGACTAAQSKQNGSMCLPSCEGKTQPPAVVIVVGSLDHSLEPMFIFVGCTWSEAILFIQCFKICFELPKSIREWG